MDRQQKTSSTNALALSLRDNMHQPLIATRLATVNDSNDLADIDTKSFEIYWSDQEWYELLRSTTKGVKKTIAVATYYGNVVGFAVGIASKGEAVIEKLAVKEQFRRKGAGRALYLDMMERAQDQRLKTISIVVPEPFVYPVEGVLNVAIPWLQSVGLKPQTPFIKDYFKAYGTNEDGVKFTTNIL